jgi:transcriptional regulator with XRE-family HTH domain
MVETGPALRKWREKSKLKREQVALAAGVSRQTIENWEKGRGEPGAAQLSSMAKLAPGLLVAIGLRGA